MVSSFEKQYKKKGVFCQGGMIYDENGFFA